MLLPGFIQGPALPGICLIIFSWSPFLELWQAILVSLTLTFGCALTQNRDSCLPFDVHKLPMSICLCGRRASALTAPDFHPWKLLAGRVLPAFVLIWAALAVAGFEPHIRWWLRDTLQSSGFGGLSDAAPVTLLATVVASGIIMTCRGIAQVCLCLFLVAARWTNICTACQLRVCAGLLPDAEGAVQISMCVSLELRNCCHMQHRPL